MMHKVALATLGLVSTALAAVPLMHTDGPETIPHEWVVVFQDNATDATIQDHMTMVKSKLTKSSEKSKVMFEYDIIKGYAIHDEADDVLPFLQSLDTDVKYIEANQVYRANQDCQLQREATWGLVRTSQRQRNLDGIYTHKPNAGGGVRAYIIDTGIYLEHSEFSGGRAVWGYDAVDTPSDFTDRNGHGTHVAGTVMATTYGIAKSATAVAVKVLGANGSGSTAGVIAGINWAARDNEQRDEPGTGNMSLGGGFSTAMNQATDATVQLGLTMIVASGNSNTNACNFSPASASLAYTVNSMDNLDRRSTFSNFGTCTDVFAPGTAITSTWIGGQFAINTISGTSMAAPHVAGVAALLHQENPTATPAQIYAMLTAESTPDQISNTGTGSPNLLIFKDCE